MQELDLLETNLTLGRLSPSRSFHLWWLERLASNCAVGLDHPSRTFCAFKYCPRRRRSDKEVRRTVLFVHILNRRRVYFFAASPSALQARYSARQPSSTCPRAAGASPPFEEQACAAKRVSPRCYFTSRVVGLPSEPSEHG